MPLTGDRRTVKASLTREGKTMDKLAGPRARHWIMAGLAAFILLTPLVAMQFTSEVDWTLSDFVFAGVMVALVSGAYELAARSRGDFAYRAGALVALAGAFVLIWADGAVGIIGDGDLPFNWAFRAVPLVALLGAAAARFRPRGMALALLATAAVHAIASTVALVAGWDQRGAVFSFILIAPWLLSAALFRRAA